MILAATAVQGSVDPRSLLILLAALGLSSTAGLRAYLPLFAVGLGSDVMVPGGNTLIPLRPEFTSLGSPVILGILGLLVLGEFTVDKLPVVDHLSDIVHTVIRPLSGALIMAGTANTLSDTHALLAAVSGGMLALAFHGVKAGTRPVVTATTAGFGNTVVSIIEDVLVVIAAALLILSPIIGVILLIVVALLFVRLITRAFRRLRGKKTGAGGAMAARGAGANRMAAGTAAQPANQAIPGRKRRGFGLGRKAAGAVAAGAGVAAALPAAARGAGGAIPAPVPVPVPSAGQAAQQNAVAPQVPAPQPTGPVSPNSTTVAGTQPVPFLPASPAPDPIQHLPQNPYGPAQTQAFPGPQAPRQAPYPDDATTMPGTNSPGSH